MATRFVGNSNEHDNVLLPIVAKFLHKWYNNPPEQVVFNGIEHVIPDQDKRMMFRNNKVEDLVFWHLKTRPDLYFMNNYWDAKISGTSDKSPLTTININAMQFMMYFTHRNLTDPFTYIVLHKKEKRICYI